MSQVFSFQNPLSSANNRCCFARFQVKLISHAPFDNERTSLPYLRSRDAHMCLLWFGSEHARDAAGHRRHPIQLEAALSHGYGGTCGVSLVGLFCCSTCGTDRSRWNMSSAPRCAHPTSSQKRSRERFPCVRGRDNRRRVPSTLSRHAPCKETAIWHARHCCLHGARYRSPHRRIGYLHGVTRAPDRCASHFRTAGLQADGLAGAYTRRAMPGPRVAKTPAEGVESLVRAPLHAAVSDSW